MVRAAKEMASPKVAEIPVSLDLPQLLRVGVGVGVGVLAFRHPSQLLTVSAIRVVLPLRWLMRLRLTAVTEYRWSLRWLDGHQLLQATEQCY